MLSLKLGAYYGMNKGVHIALITIVIAHREIGFKLGIIWWVQVDELLNEIGIFQTTIRRANK